MRGIRRGEGGRKEKQQKRMKGKERGKGGGKGKIAKEDERASVM